MYVRCPSCKCIQHLRISIAPDAWLREHSEGEDVDGMPLSTCFLCYKLKRLTDQLSDDTKPPEPGPSSSPAS